MHQDQAIDLMIAGPPKCGTTSILRYLAAHPAVGTHPWRETTLFQQPIKDRAAYEAGFHEMYGHTSKESMLVAKDADLARNDEAIARLAEFSPTSKLLLCLRDPVKRAYSNYWHNHARGVEPEPTFEAAIEACERRGSARTGVDHRDYVGHGLYADHYESLVDAFSKDQVSVLFLDELKRDAAGTIRGLYEGLGVDTSFLPDLERKHNVGRGAKWPALSRLLQFPPGPVRAVVRKLPPSIRGQLSNTRRRLFLRTTQEFQPPPIDPSTREAVGEHFTASDERLVRALGLDSLPW